MKITKNKNQYFSYLQKQFSKFAVVLVVVSMLFGTLGINQTSAYFTSSAIVSGNTFTAGTLSIDLNNTNTFSSGLLYPTESTGTSMDISNTGSLSSQYIAKITLLGGDTSACDYVTMTTTSPTSSSSVLIKDFISDTIPTTNATWNYNFTISPTAPASVWNKTCFFKWTYTAWQDNLNDASTGFTSVKDKLGAINIGKAVVLNEFIPDPSGLDDALKPGGEWIELFNNSSLPIDLSGWVIYDNTDSHELPITNLNTNTGGTTIAPHGFLVVYKNGDSDFILNNAGDSVRLATGYPITSSVVVDSYTYTTEKPEGFSYARNHDGTGDWVDPIPTPGSSNELPPVIEAVEDITTPEIPDTTTDDATATTDNDTTVDTGTDTTVDESELTTTEETATVKTTTTDTTEPTADSEEVTEPETIIEPEVAPTENTDDATVEQPAVEEPIVEAPVVEPVSNEIK